MFSINTGKNVTNMPPSRYEVESKYKSIVDLSSKLEAHFNQAKSLQQLYSSSLLSLRQRLCDEIKVIFRYAPIEYGLHCEEILWKRNYYDYVKFCKKNRKLISSNEMEIFRMHITSGIGHYQSLFFSFRKTFNLTNLEDFLSYLPFKPNSVFKVSDIINYNRTGLNEAKCSALKSVLEDESTLDENNYIGDIDDDDEGVSNELDYDYVQDEKFLPTLSFLAHRFCICLGDLARYYVDFFPRENFSSVVENRFSHYYFNIASFYYKSASIIEPSLGMPFNQLGTLYTGSCWGLDSLYYYVRCLNSKKTFIGVKENMRHTFESVRKMLSSSNMNGSRMANSNRHFGHISKPKLLGAADQSSTNQLVKEAILRTINLFSELFNMKSTLNDNRFPVSVANLLTTTNETLVKLSLAFNAEPSLTSSRTSPGAISTESIFQVMSIFAILIEQIKAAQRENSFEVKFESAKSIKTEDMLGDAQLKANFILFAAYRFLFQFLTLLIKRESDLLRKWLRTIPTYSSVSSNKLKGKGANSVYDGPSKDGNVKPNKLNSSMLATSFFSEFNDAGEDCAMLNQAQSTVMQSIVTLFDQSDNEDAGEEEPEEEEDEGLNGNQSGDDSDNESVSDLIDKLIFSDEENDLMEDGTSLIDQALVRNAASRSAVKAASESSKMKQQMDRKNAANVPKADSKTMDQLLDYMYTQSHTPVIKFFCDFLQSNADFLDLLEHLDVLPFFFESFFDYLNLVSEFDFKLVTNFRHYVSKCTLAASNEHDHKKIQSLLELKVLINKLASEQVTEFKQKQPLSSELDYLHITQELSAYFDELFDLSSDSAKNFHQINLQTRYSNEQYGFICMRSILVFGIKLALLSLNSNTFQMSLEDYSATSIHNLPQKKPVKFVFSRVGSKQSLLSPFGSISNSLPLINNNVSTNEPLINFNDASDKEVENACSGSEANFVVKSNFENKKKSTNVAGSNDYKSLYALSKLPFVMIDPFVYLENLNFVRELVIQKKAFLIVPKLATDFLNNLKEKNEKAREASDFLMKQFFEGSRIIRFIRNDCRMELDIPEKYPRYQWHRDVVPTGGPSDTSNLVKVQDLALLYELLEHCHYLLVNKVLVDKSQDSAPSLNGNCDSQSIRITLITNNLAKWPSAAPTIAKTYGIDMETMHSYLEKQAFRANKPFNKQQSKPKRAIKAAQSSSPMFFRPIQNERISHPLT